MIDSYDEVSPFTIFLAPWMPIGSNTVLHFICLWDLIWSSPVTVALLIT